MRTFFKHEMGTRMADQRAAALRAEVHRRAVYGTVNRRDGYQCRACGTHCNPRAYSLLRKAHHHHIVYQSQLGDDSTENVCLLCCRCHSDEHVSKTLHVEGNADVALTFTRMRVDTGEWYVWRREIRVRVFEQPLTEEVRVKQQLVRQGDVVVRPCADAVRSGQAVSDAGRVILAYGEVTGHAHEVVDAQPGNEVLPPAALFEQPDGRRFLFVDRPCLLCHQEHGPIALAPGSYEVVRQREYSPEAIRNVTD